MANSFQPVATVETLLIIVTLSLIQEFAFEPAAPRQSEAATIKPTPLDQPQACDVPNSR